MRLAMRLRTSPAGLTVERHSARRPQSWQPEKRKVGSSILPLTTTSISIWQAC
jgi:hypothetical protein